LRVAVVGASGYTGLELLRILARHPRVELVAVTSEQRAGTPVGRAFPSLAGLIELDLEAASPAALAGRADVAFTCLPHAASAPAVRDLRKAGIAVIDLSADFRLRDPEAYRRAYGEHGAPELFGQAVYGLPELHRTELPGAEFVAAPGCYPTSVLLPLAPFLREGLVETDAIVADCKSGVSGAGRKADVAYLFAEVDENVFAYKVGGAHRHVPEMEQEASLAAGREVRIAFTPQLLPVIRGIATSVYARPTRKLTTADARAVLDRAYRAEPFVRVLPEGATPSLQSVRGANFCDVTAVVDERTGLLVLLSALDNLVKGASGQAVQCLNAMRGWPETEGLREAPLVP
jgi:N-acetyl-gamma-glutamyl-phosphate reductase